MMRTCLRYTAVFCMMTSWLQLSVTGLYIDDDSLGFHRLRRNIISDSDLAMELFRIGNQNNDDVLNEEEIAEFYRQYVDFPQSVANFMAQGMISNGDQDNDGNLNFFETVAGISAIRSL